MKKIFGALIALFTSVAFGATLVPIQLLNPTGSSSGQAIVSTGASSAPAWGGIGVNGIAAIAANTVLANATASSAAPTAFAMPSCSASASALNWTTSTGFTCSSVSGTLVGVQVFTSSGTYTPDTGTNSVIVEVQAPGGGSGGTSATSSSQTATSPAGGAGSYAYARFTSGYSGVTVTIGAAGTAGAAGGAGGTGGTTSFGSLISCNGGPGGGAAALGSGTGFVNPVGGAAACTITGASVTLASVAGGASTYGTILNSTQAMPGFGGTSFLGRGGFGSAGTGVGGAPTGYGAGAGGSNTLPSGAAQAGQAGGTAIVRIYEYR